MKPNSLNTKINKYQKKQLIVTKINKQETYLLKSTYALKQKTDIWLKLLIKYFRKP